MYHELDRVILIDGTIVDIALVFGDGEAYQVEYATPDGEHAYEDRTVKPDEIEGLYSESISGESIEA